MQIKTTFLLFFCVFTIACTASTADKKADWEKDNEAYYKEDLDKTDIGYWDIKACKRTSDGAGTLMATTGYLLDQSGKLREAGDEDGADDLFTASEKLSAIAANLAVTFTAFCK